MVQNGKLARKVTTLISGIVLLSSLDSANADEKRENRAETEGSKSIGIIKKIQSAASYLKNSFDLLELVDAKANGDATSAQYQAGGTALGNIGTNASRTMAMATGGTLLSVTNALVAQPLTAVAQSEGGVLNRITSAQKAWEDAVNSGDSAAIERVGLEIDNFTPERANFKPDMGSDKGGMWDAISAAASSAGVKVLDSSVAYLKLSIENISKTKEQTKKLDIDSHSLSSNDVPEPFKWRVDGEGYDGKCNISIDIDTWWNSVVPLLKYGVLGASCKRQQLKKHDESTYSSTLECRENGAPYKDLFISGMGKIDDEEILVKTIYTNDQHKWQRDVDSFRILKCQKQPDCSPEGQRKWKAEHLGSPVVFCSNPQ